MQSNNKSIVYVVNVDWFFISHRLPLAIEAKNRGYKVAIIATNTGRFRELEDLGFQLFDLRMGRSGTNPFKELFFILKLIIYLNRIKPTVIHNVTLKMSIYSTLATRFVHKAKVINAISGMGYTFTADRKTKFKRIITLLMKLAFYNRQCSFIFQNPDDLNDFHTQNFDQGNSLFLIKGAGIDLDKFKYLERNGRQIVTFILTARMLKDKGIKEFITASKIISHKYPNTRFMLVGDIDLENPASFREDELLNELSGTNIQWLGPRDDILELLQDADVMVFPSYREGLPKSLIEAAAVGLPIITTDTVGCRECVDDGINGFLVPVGNPNRLADKMAELIDDPLLMKEMGKASRIKAEREFSLKMVIEKTFALYE